MVWSLSKDDDGLEPVVPSEAASDAGAAPYHASTSGHRALRPSSSPPGYHSSHPPSTVVVDPVSQFPQASPFASSSHRTAEPTRILSSRKVDELRAQVLVHRRNARRKKTVQFVSWGLAGALALAAGGILAGGLLPLIESRLSKDISSQGTGEEPSPSALADSQPKIEPQATVSAASSAAPPLVRAEQTEPKPQLQDQPQERAPDSAHRAVSLEELEQEDSGLAE